MGHTDWLLTKSERANAQTVLDARHEGDVAWSEGNLVRPLIHGSTYFAELYERVQETKEGDLVLFTDWAGDADEQLTDDPDSKVVDVLGRADERGVDVRGLIWRSHWEMLNFSAEHNRTLGRAAAGPRRRGTARHAGAHRWLAPPEAGRDPPSRRPHARRRLRRRASTCATPAATTPGTSATLRTSRWRRSTATPRRGTT